jgi:hypothetical protein
MNSAGDLFASDPLMIAEQRRHHAVREALRLIVAGHGLWAVDVLGASVHRCSRLDNRPLDPVAVSNRYDAAVRALTDLAT